MKKRLFQWLFIGFSLLIALPTYATVGHQETVQMWNTVVSKVKPYRLQMQKLYAEAESLAGRDKSKVRQDFNLLLAKRFPGSVYYGNISTLKVNNYTTVYFDSNWTITALLQDFDGLVKHYKFREKTLDIHNGPNRIIIKLDLNTPENSSFVAASIPAIKASVIDVWTKKGKNILSTSPLMDILNDAYNYRLGTVGDQRMDTLAEEMLSDSQKRQYVLSTAANLYASKPIPESKFATPSPRTATVPRVSVPSVFNSKQLSTQFVSLFERLFKSFFWPIVIFFLIVVSLKAFTLNRLRKRIWKKVRSVGFDMDTHYESRNTLHTPAEQTFHNALQRVVDGDQYQINGKTRLADLIQVRGSQVTPGWQSAFNRIKSKHVDFVIIEKGSSRILGVIELDDSSHNRSDRIERDQFVDKILKQAGIPILHVPWCRNYPLLELEQRLSDVLGMSSPREFSLGPVTRTDF